MDGPRRSRIDVVGLFVGAVRLPAPYRFGGNRFLFFFLLFMLFGSVRLGGGADGGGASVGPARSEVSRKKNVRLVRNALTSRRR